MRTKMKLIDKVLCCLNILFNANFTKGTKALYCPNCRGNRFEDVEISETEKTYNAKYICKHCGAEVSTSEIWKF